MNQQGIDAMADIMVQSRKNNEDVGELVAAALHDLVDLITSRLPAPPTGKGE